MDNHTRFKKVLAKLKSDFPESFPASPVNDPNADRIVERLRTELAIPYIMLRNYKLWALKEDFPSAFKNGQVEWERLAYDLFDANAEADEAVTQAISNLSRKIPKCFPTYNKQDPKQLKAMLKALKEMFPHAFMVPGMPDEDAPLFDDLERRYQPEDEQGNWGHIVMGLYMVNIAIGELVEVFPEVVKDDGKLDNELTEKLLQESEDEADIEWNSGN